MLRALVFDFNGVISDDESIHQEALCQALREEGICLSAEQYQAGYLGRDDRDCLRMAFNRAGRNLSPEWMRRLIVRKSHLYLQWAPERVRLFAGVLPLLEEARGKLPMAIASGALRPEVELVLEKFQLRRYFCAVVTQEDVGKGKPDPEIFVKALDAINQSPFYQESVRAEECLVVEDSPAGIEAAREAGMRCLAVSHSQPPENLGRAERVVASLRLHLSDLNW